MRRTKKDMQQMESDVRYYLTYNNLDGHKAYDNFIKDYLLSGISLPYYISGIKDFLKIATIMKIEDEQKKQQKNREQEQQQNKKSIIEKILNISTEKFINAYRQAKVVGTEKHKMVLADMSMLKSAGELQEKFITNYYIDICREYQLI